MVVMGGLATVAEVKTAFLNAHTEEKVRVTMAPG